MNAIEPGKDWAQSPPPRRTRDFSDLRRWGLQKALISSLAALALLTLVQAPLRAQDDNHFHAFVTALWPQAARHGVSRAIFDAAMAGITPDPAILAHTQTQAEFVKPIGDYLASAVSDDRITRGRDAAAEWQRTLAKIERIYGVDRYTLLGVWGIEFELRRLHRQYQCHPGARHARRCRLSRQLFQGRVDHRIADSPGGSRRLAGHDGVVGRRHGTDAIHAFELHEICRRFPWRRPQEYLDGRPRCPRLDRQLPRPPRLDPRLHLGL